MVSTNPRHIISLTEHLNWWINNHISKFKILKSNNIIGYCWFKINTDIHGDYLTSGWFFNNKIDDKLKTSIYVQDKLNILAKENYKKIMWIIITKKNNKFVNFINKKNKFIIASSESMSRAKYSFKTQLNDYFVMEKKI